MGGVGNIRRQGGEERERLRWERERVGHFKSGWVTGAIQQYFLSVSFLLRACDSFCLNFDFRKLVTSHPSFPFLNAVRL